MHTYERHGNYYHPTCAVDACLESLPGTDHDSLFLARFTPGDPEGDLARIASHLGRHRYHPSMPIRRPAPPGSFCSMCLTFFHQPSPAKGRTSERHPDLP